MFDNMIIVFKVQHNLSLNQNQFFQSLHAVTRGGGVKNPRFDRYCNDWWSLKTAAKYKHKVAEQKQQYKLKKYQDNPNIMGIGVEILGAMSSNGKKLINEIAKRLEIKNNIDQSIHVNRIRSNLLAIMMKHNASMVIKCYN